MLRRIFNYLRMLRRVKILIIYKTYEYHCGRISNFMVFVGVQKSVNFGYFKGTLIPYNTHIENLLVFWRVLRRLEIVDYFIVFQYPVYAILGIFGIFKHSEVDKLSLFEYISISCKCRIRIFAAFRELRS